MTTLLQISDAHFGTERPPVVQALLQLARDQAPDLVVMSGDITQRARRSQFKAARAFIDQLKPAALLTIPGNHDIPLFNLALRAFAPYSNYSRAFGKNLEPLFESANLLVIGVNTTRPYKHVDGELSPQQIERVADRLRHAAPSQLRIIVVHQPVLAIRESDADNLLDGHRRAIPAWAAAGGDIIMGGHIHLPYVRSLQTTFDALPRDIWTVQAGTAVSSRLREGITNSVNLIRCNGAQSPRQCMVERWDYIAMSSRFERHTSQELTFDGSTA
jgi:3',5'-cyclic AMP phosphodiesterase CpdA